MIPPMWHDFFRSALGPRPTEHECEDMNDYRPAPANHDQSCVLAWDDRDEVCRHGTVPPPVAGFTPGVTLYGNLPDNDDLPAVYERRSMELPYLDEVLRGNWSEWRGIQTVSSEVRSTLKKSSDIITRTGSILLVQYRRGPAWSG